MPGAGVAPNIGVFRERVTPAPDILLGAADAEFIAWLGGDGLFNGGNGDILRGWAYNDTISDADNRDAMLDNAGDDTMIGGCDRDILWFGIAPVGTNSITDFTIGDDLLDFLENDESGLGRHCYAFGQ